MQEGTLELPREYREKEGRKLLGCHKQIRPASLDHGDQIAPDLLVWTMDKTQYREGSLESGMVC